jgi:hypothetical protein
MPDMVHYIAVFELPDGEHLMTGTSDSLQMARKHVDGYMLNRRRALIPDERVVLKSIRLIHPDKLVAEVEMERDRILKKYPDRMTLDERFDTPNRVMDTRVTPEPDMTESGLIIPPTIGQ